MDIRRYKDIIAAKTSEGIIAYHASNLEVAEISLEAFQQMSPITLKNGQIPTTSLSSTEEAAQSLENWQAETNPDVLSGELHYGIKSLTINVTQICNLKCTYCAAGGDGTYGDPVNRIQIEKTLPQLKFFLDKLPNNSDFNLSFVGGEPLLYPEALKAIYDYVLAESSTRQIRCKFMVTTNATVISDSTLDILSRMKIHVTVSLDGKAEINDSVRPTKNKTSSTELTLHGLKQLAKIKNNLASIGISGVYSSENMNVLESYQYFRTLGADWYEFNFSYTETCPEAQKAYLSQMEEVAALAWNLGQEAELRKIKTFNLYFQTLDSQQRVQNYCGAGKSFLMIDAKNQLYTCPWVVGEKAEIVGSEANLDHSKLAKYQKPLIELNNCQTCWARFICGGGCMFINKAHTGDKHKKDELFCERTRGLILLAILYYKRARAD